MIVMLTVLPWSKYAQLYTHLGCTCYVITFIAEERPLVDRFVNNQEIFNELSVLLAIYPLFVFTPWVDDPEMRVGAGWALVGCLMLNILFNIVVVIYQACLACYRAMRRR